MAIGTLTMTEERLYTVTEVAKILRVSPRTVRNMIRDKELAAFMIRDEWRIRQSALDEIMRERNVEDEDKPPHD